MNKKLYLIFILLLLTSLKLFSQNHLINTTWETITNNGTQQKIVFGKSNFKWTESQLGLFGNTMPFRNQFGTYIVQGEIIYFSAPGFTNTGILLGNTLTVSMDSLPELEFRRVQPNSQNNSSSGSLLRTPLRTAKDFYTRGNMFFNRNNLESAIANYNEAIRLNNNYAIAYHNRGLAYLHNKKYDQALADFSQAIKLNPNHANAYHNRGVVYERLNDYNRAIADYTEALRLDPNHPNSRQGMENAQRAARK